MNSLKSHKDKMKKNQEKGRRLKVITLLCSLFVVGAVLWGLILPGIAMSGKTYCGLEEHTHGEDCYTTELTCGQEESEDHTHSQACYSQVLTCDKEEHTHTEACQSNPEADLETAENWEASFADSGYEEGETWNQKITAIAESQLGYTESQDNFALGDDNSHKGYTRYGVWATATTDYGTWTAEDMTYSDWDSLLAAFTLKYAGVDTNAFPVYSDVNAWMDALKAADLFGDASSSYQAGDLVFFNKSGDQETLYQVGIIDIVGSGDDGAKTAITVIQGNDDNTVKETTYQVSDSQILGYGLVSKAWENSQGTQETGNVENTENTENNNNIEEKTSSSNKQTENNLSVLSDNTSGSEVDEGLTLNISASTAEGKNGQTLTVNVASINSHPNTTGTNEKIKLDIGTLPEGVELVGFTNGEMKVHYGDETTGGNIEVTLHKNKDGTSYITYTQPAGSTIYFQLSFNSENGIMDKENTVTVTPSIENKASNDFIKIDGTDTTAEGAAQNLTLKWTGENKWNNLRKSVDHTTLEINEETNTLVGSLKYTIKAQEYQADGANDTGSIWTEKVVLEDTLTLPEGMTLPTGAKVDNDKVVDKDGKEIFAFDFSSLTRSGKQSVKVDSVAIASDNKSISYKITITNTNKDGDTYKGEMDSISNLTADLDASRLVLDDSYKTMTEGTLKTKEIKNKVSIKTTDVKGNDTYTDEKEVVTVPTKTEKYSITKSAKQDNKDVANKTVQPGSTIDYTITVKNDGYVTLPAKDANGKAYTITDTLPEQLALTDEQQQEIRNAGGIVTKNADGTYTITISQSKEIKAGDTWKFTFKANVKSEKELTEGGLSTSIYNGATYRDNTAGVTVNVEKTKINLNKTVDRDKDVKNGDILTYTITVENPNNTKVDFDQVLSDTLDQHLKLQGMYDSQGKEIDVGADGKYDAESTVSGGKHQVVLTNTQDNGKTTLKWTVGSLAAKEKVTIIYKVKVDLNDGGSISSITNTVTSNHGGKGEDTVDIIKPTTVDKKVKASTEDDAKYNDGGESYNDQTVLDYQISIKNASGDEASTYDKHLLTDTIQAGLLLKDVGTIYTGASKELFEAGSVTSMDNLRATSYKLEQVLDKTSEETGWGPFFIKIGDDLVMLERDAGKYSTSTTYGTKLTWFIGKIDAGKTVTKNYKVTLNMANSDKNGTSYINTVTGGGDSKTVTVKGKKDGESLCSADIKKDVWTIAKGSESKDNGLLNQLNNKKYFSIDNDGDKYVIYSITAANTGDEDITVKKITDEYGANLEYLAISNSLYNVFLYTFKQNNKWNDEIQTVNQYNMSSWLDLYSQESDVTIKMTENDTTTYTATYQVGDKNKGVTLPVGKTISFFVLCRVKNPTEGTAITNTAKLYVDKDVAYKDYGTIKTKGTKDDAYQNNGSSQDEGLTTDGTQRVISSSVNIIPENCIIPGITKNATAYIPAGRTIDNIQAVTAENKETNISPRSAVKWELNLYNDGTIPIESYTISDTVDSPFHILTSEEAKALGITDANKASNKVFLLEIYDSKSSTSPSKTYDFSSTVWASTTKTQTLSVSVTQSLKCAIPVGGYAKFTVYTNGTDQNFKIYQNTATFSPTESFDGTKVTTGQVVENTSGQATGVTASDSVCAMGEYGSFSWKTIAEEANTNNQAFGYNTSNNYIVIDKEDTNKKVVYTNNIKNVSQHEYKNLTILDLMPFKGDTGVLNHSQTRGSEFSVAYNGELVLTVKDKDGNVTKTLTSGTDYSIQFSDKTSFTEADTGHGSSNNWHDTWASEDKSFRILLGENFTLQPNETLCIQYQGLIGKDVVPGKIAWNSFGYAYDVEGMSRLRAEPPKVGVKIPISPTISKKVVDSVGNDKGTDTSKTFTFKVYEGNSADQSKLKGTFTLYQGEVKKINSIKDTSGKAIFKSGETYTLVELVDSSYTFQSVKSSTDTSATNNNNGYTFTYNSAQDSYSITFTNKLNEYELPGTGGIGTIPFLVSGAALMCAAALLFGYNLKRKRR